MPLSVDEMILIQGACVHSSVEELIFDTRGLRTFKCVENCIDSRGWRIFEKRRNDIDSRGFSTNEFKSGGYGFDSRGFVHL